MLNMPIIYAIVTTSFFGRYCFCLTGQFDCFLMKLLLDLLRPIRLVFQVVPLYSLVNSYLVSYLCSLTFFQPLQLVVVVVGFCLHFLSTMLNACVTSSFKWLVSLVVCPISWPGLVSIHMRISTLSFDPGLQCFLCPFSLGLSITFLSFSPGLSISFFLFFVQCVYPVTKLCEVFRGNLHWLYSLT